MIPIIDIFAGPGGLGEGFSSLLNEFGERTFKIKLSIEKEGHAHQTLLLRAFYRQFDQGAVQDEYYEVLRTGKTIDDLFALYPSQSAKAKAEAVQETLGPDSWQRVSSKIEHALHGESDWLLIGGPPCQAYSIVGRSRNKSKKNYEPLKDDKHFLYREYLRIIASFWPAVFVMENVKGLLSSKPDPKKDPIFARILVDLAAPAESEDITTIPAARQHRYKLYSLSPRRTNGEPAGSEFILRAEEHGVPQARHRVIIVGVRDDFSDEIPDSLQKCPPVAISKVLKQMPALRGRITDLEDSDAAWLDIFSEIEDRRWFKSMGKFGPYGITEVATRVLRGLTVPAAKRGGEFVACIPGIGYWTPVYTESAIIRLVPANETNHQ
jgi:DNA (cytosine-5)-methyltransferase 1